MEKQTKTGYKYFQRVQDNTVPHHIKQVSVNKINFSRPTIIEFGGSGTINLSSINGYLKTTESQLKGLSKNVNIIGIDYNTGAIYEQQVKSAVQNCESFIEEILVPLSLDNLGNINVHAACKNLRNIILKSHSMGHEVVFYVNMKFKKRLIELGYNEEESNLIMSQIFEISYGSEYVPLGFSQMYLTSLGDYEVRDNQYPLYALTENINNIVMSEEDRKQLKNLAQNEFNEETFLNFFKQNERVYAINDSENSLVLCFSYPVDKNHDDHALYFSKLGKDSKRSERATNVGYHVALSISAVLCGLVENFIKNSASNNLTCLSIKELASLVNKTTKSLNSNPPAYSGEKGE